MTRPDRVTTVAELVEHFCAADAVLPTKYHGLTVGRLEQLCRGPGEDTTYAVAKNTLARLTARGAGFSFLVEDLKDPTAIASVSGEPVEATKILRDFVRDNSALVLKSGAMDDAQLSAETVKKPADLEPREVLLVKTIGVLKAKIGQATFASNALPVRAMCTIDVLREKQSEAA